VSARSPITEYLDQLDGELRMKRVPRRRLLAEAEDHLRCSAEELAGGVAPEQAAQIAVERFGAAAVVARGFAQGVASRTARCSFVWAGLALVLYGAAGVAFAVTAAPQFDDFPQGAPTALAGQIAVAALALTTIRALRWRREPVLPEDRIGLIASGSVIASAALSAGLLAEARRPHSTGRRLAVVRGTARSRPVRGSGARGGNGGNRCRRGVGAKLHAGGRPRTRDRA